MKLKVVKMKKVNFICLSFLIVFQSIIFSQIPQNVFIKNNGQWDNKVKYALFTNSLNFFITNQTLFFDYFSLQTTQSEQIKVGNVIKFEIIGGKYEKFLEISPTNWYLNFFLSNDPLKWKKNVKGFNKLKVLNVLPYIDLVLTSSSLPRYDFVVRPFGNPENIIIKVEGAQIIRCNKEEIVFQTSLGEIVHRNLFVYQKDKGKYKQIEASFKLITNNTFAFEIGQYDKTTDLIIDPLVFSSLMGGSGGEEIVDIVETSHGTVYVTGWTESPNFPTTPGAYSSTFTGEKDIFISKINVKGSKRELIFSTLLGGSSTEKPVNVLVDNQNCVYVGVTTNSNDLPQVNSMSKTSYGLNDAYICKFNPDCNEILFSTYFGGSKDDILTSIKLSGDNGIYLTGYTNSTDLPITGGAYQGSLKGKNDIFFAKISNTGQTIRTCTYIGGIEDDFAYDMCVTPSEYVYIGGATKSNDFPAFPVRVLYYGSYEWVIESPFDRTYNGNFDGVVIKILGSSGALEYASFFGGLADDFVTTVGYYGNDERVVFAGKTFKEPSNITFPLTQTAFQNNIKGQEEAFVASLSNINITSQYGYTYKSQNLIFSTFLGGSGTDVPTSITFNKSNQNFYIVGYTTSTNFPIVNNPSGKKLQKNDIFFVSMLSDGSALAFSNILGGNDDDFPNKIYLNFAGDYYIVGRTSSTNFPIINPVKDLSSNSFPDGFILKNVDATLRFEAPFGNEEYCPGASLQVKWAVEGITNPDSFDIELKSESSDEWILAASDIKGLSTTLTLPSNISGKVWIRVSHPKGLIATINSPIVVLEPPKLISFTPDSDRIELCEGDSIILSVSAQGARLKYQWLFNNLPIDNANDSSLVLNKIELSNSGKYKVIISGVCPPKIESQEISINVIPKTEILSHSPDTTVKINEDLILYVQCKGQNLSYQWYKNNIKLLGEKNNILRLNKVSKMDEGVYLCIIEGTCGSDTTKQISVFIDTNISKVDFESYLPQIFALNQGNIIKVFINNSLKYSNISTSIIDILGRKVLNQNFTVFGQKEFDIDISSLTSGTYLLTLQNDKFKRNFLFIKNW